MKTKVALVSGSNSELGVPITQLLLQLGYQVFGQFHSNREPLRKITDPSLVPIQANLLDVNQCRSLVNQTVKGGGKIDLLVNLVGPFDHRPISQFSPEEWNHAIQLNLNTVFNLTYYAIPHLNREGSQIINFTYAGVENHRALPNATAYAAAKAGVAILSKSLAAELALKKIRVNTISPGWIESSTFSEKQREEIKLSLPTNRLGRPDEVAEVVRWLVAEAPTYVTGANISVAGAWEL